MDYNKNIRYFKSSDAHFYIGIVVLAVGAILFLLSQAFWLYLIPYQPVVGLFVAVIGAVIAWVPRSLRSSEKDIDGASVKNEKVTLPNGTRVELVWFVLSAGGKEALQIPATQSAVLDKLCGDINYAIAQWKNASLS